jgi:hypothetical protein
MSTIYSRPAHTRKAPPAIGSKITAARPKPVWTRGRRMGETSVASLAKRRAQCEMINLAALMSSVSSTIPHPKQIPRNTGTPCQPSEIRLGRRRDLCVLFGAVFVWVFGADIFCPFEHRLAVRYGRGPGCREDARILDRDEEL